MENTPKLLYTREEAIEQIVQDTIEAGWDHKDHVDLLVNGWKGKPLSKHTNKELEKQLREDCDDDRIRVIRQKK